MLLESSLLDFDKFTLYLLGIDHKLREGNNQKANFLDNLNLVQEVDKQFSSKSIGFLLNY
jgi:hypothetical protein